MCEERAQGNGATTVRVMRQRTQARQGGGIPPTKYRAANGGCSAREESRFSPKGETNACVVSPAPEDALRGHGRGLAERNPFRRGGLHRTRPRSRICIRRAGRRTGKAPASKGEHGCPDRDRTLEGRTHQHRTSTSMRSKPHIGRQNPTHHTRQLSGMLRLCYNLLHTAGSRKVL